VFCKQAACTVSKKTDSKTGHFEFQSTPLHQKILLYNKHHTEQSVGNVLLNDICFSGIGLVVQKL